MAIFKTETTISDFHTSFYIKYIQTLAFNIPHVLILGTNQCDEMRRTAFKRRKLFQDVLCCCDYSDRVVAIFAHQIQSECYGGNRSVSIEGIALENVSALPMVGINSTTHSLQCHAVFHYFYLIIAKNMLPLLLHTASVSLHFLKTKQY